MGTVQGAERVQFIHVNYSELYVALTWVASRNFYLLATCHTH